MKPLTFKITKDCMLLFVLLTLLWGAADSNNTNTNSTTATSKPTTTTTTNTTIAQSLTTSLTIPSTTQQPPENVKNVSVLSRNVSSITLRWDKVKNISTYSLQYDNGRISINASLNEAQVTQGISPLKAGTKYNFTVITVFNGVNSTGYSFSAVTVPNNTEEFKSVGRNETSITLQWKQVDSILNYVLKFNNRSINVDATKGNPLMNYTVPDLKSGTKYNFTLFTVFENVSSTGVNLTAVTAPVNAGNFNTIGQNETSITLQWKQVDSILNYVLKVNNRSINVDTTKGNPLLNYTVPDLKSGTKYNFVLFTVFENVSSTGVNLTAVTAPVNAGNFSTIRQNETSITLQWKQVDSILNYVLKFNNRSINVDTTKGDPLVNYIVPDLKSGTKYNFTLFTVFENVSSTGVNLTAVTAPVNAGNFSTLGQNQTSITLQWKQVDSILNYDLSYNPKNIMVNATQNIDKTVIYTVSHLYSGTKYNFTLYTVFENVRSSGETLCAATQPRDTDKFTVTEQTKTSITLQWKKVDDIRNYKLKFNKETVNVNATENENVTYTASNLINGTKYNFTLFTVFENLSSTGITLSAVTAPRNADGFKAVGQTETNITLQWEGVDDILNYIVQYNNKEINIKVPPQTLTVPGLESGTKYNFVLFTLFENVKSTGINITAATAPENVKNVSVLSRSVSNITLRWDKVKNISMYILQYDNSRINISASLNEAQVTQGVSSLKPGTKYDFAVITVFNAINSTGYRFSAVTTIDCALVPWHVSNSSIQGFVDGLFMNATATYAAQTHVSVGGRNVSFSGLYPGATYQISLVYGSYEQCRHNLTILPADLRAHCEYQAFGYSILVGWNQPDGVWTEVEVNVTGKTYNVKNDETSVVIPGFSPAKTYEVSVAALSGTLRSSVPFVFQCPTDPTSVIVGSVFGVLLFGFLVCLVVFILLRRPELIRRNTFMSGSEIATKTSNAISVEAFAEHFYKMSADDNRGFSIEYESLIPVGTEQTRKAALLPENKSKNRFNNVLPYDWCRVKLNTETCDYINANYMPGYSSSRQYIATQGPLPSTVNDFWRMIWEQNVRGIVMVTNCTEGGRTKCEQYWPADSNSRLYGEMVVTMRSEEQEPNWTLREFSLKHRDTTEQRTVKHFHFTSWPDHGVPQCTEVLIQFRALVRYHIETGGTKAPTVVHCSAGVGRTGTIIALDVLLQQLEKKRAVDINGFVHKMRLNRPHMVQTESQYIFLHQCIMDSLQSEERTDEHIYENTEMIYANATALQEFRLNSTV